MASKHDPKKPIFSAELVAWARALAVRDPEFPGSDDLAEIFLRPSLRLMLRPFGWWRWLVERRGPGFYQMHHSRTLYLDAALHRAIDDGATQFVTLGAGNDSRSYRFADRFRAHGVRAFEVDFPGTQERKKRILREHFGTLPDHVTYVPIDFESERLGDVLPAAGYDPERTTFFVWEGVTCFLHPPAIDAVLAFVAETSAAGSRIGFDLLERRIIEGDVSGFGVRKMVFGTRFIGEPFVFGLSPEELPGFLEERGLGLVDESSPEVLRERFFEGRADRRASDGFRMVTASVV